MAPLFLCFFGFMVIRMSVAYCMPRSSIIYSTIYGESLSMIVSRVVQDSNGFTLLALSFFVLASNIMNRGGVTDRIFNFCKKTIGWIPGGLGHVNVLASMVSTGVSGSAVADAGGLGATEIKTMKDDGYDGEFAAAITGASPCIRSIIPPTISGVVYCVTGDVSAGKMFIADILPGYCLAVMQMTYAYIVIKKREYPRMPFNGFRNLSRSFVTSFSALLTPVTILRGIITGICTPTEASVAAVLHVLVQGFLARGLKWKDMLETMDNTFTSVMSTLSIVSCANALGYIITAQQIPGRLAAVFLSVVTNKFIVLLIINIFLLLVGIVVESLATLVILVPILMPVIASFSVDPLHFGIVYILNITIGMLTPPVGIVLFALPNVNSLSFERITRVMLPLPAVNFIALLMVTYYLPLTIQLPNLIM